MALGKVHSLQSLGTLDGPGIRYVVFLQGCNLRCGCCHNPDTWAISGGTEYSAQDLIAKALRYREYFGNDGGITVSGGEPLLQPDFVRELFELAHKNGLNTCLDTSGTILNDSVMRLLAECDRVLLDIKYATDEKYLNYVGCGISKPIKFLDYLNESNISVTVRQVIIPTLNDDDENIIFLNELRKKYPCIDKVELLPFKKICQVKYDNMGIKFRFADIPSPSREVMSDLHTKLN